MKILKYLLYLILALVVVFLIMGLMGPKDYDVNREMVVDAPPEVVYQHFSSFEKMDKWGPWKEADPNQKTTYSGEPGTVGHSSAWEGNDEVGKGVQTIKSLDPNKGVVTDLHFIEPWESKAEGYSKFEPADGGTKITWGFRGKNEGLMAKAMGMMMDMDDMVGPMFEKGLNKLKGIVETEAAALASAAKGPITHKGYTMQRVDYGGGTYLGHREKIAMSAMKDFFTQHFGASFGAVMGAGSQPASVPSGLYYEWDEENGMTDVFAGVMLKKEDVEKFTDKETATVEPSKALKLEYTGGYAGSYGAHMAISEAIKENNIEFNNLVIEEYVTDPEQEPDSNKWVTNILYLIK